MSTNKQIAAVFGQSLDNDQFDRTKQLLSANCTYRIGDELVIGPEEICNSYRQNMLEGRTKLDVLEWGSSKIEAINGNEFYVHFTDHLTHNNKKHIHRCKQLIEVNDDGLICSIQHIENREEENRLQNFYNSVGLK